ncbi:MAG: rod shape-determining protein MreD [Candidatus Krumholzibacteria bacterium]|jgi:rod shape-determining protein MreD|nr:rod shape-determining protein MreD [Candidatus Krumholzibacteria bacterium]
MTAFVRTTLTWVLLAVLGESVVAPAIAFGNVAPDFTVIAIVLLAMARGARAGAIGGFSLGLIQDLAVPTMLGLHALCKVLLGYGVGWTRGRLIYGLVLVEAALLFAAGLGHDTLFLLVQSWQRNDAFLATWFSDVLPTALYTAVAGVPLLRLADLFGILRRED